MQLVKYCDMLHSDGVEVASLETFKVILDGTLSIVIWLKMSLLTAGGLKKMTFESPIQLDALYDSMTQMSDCFPESIGASCCKADV